MGLRIELRTATGHQFMATGNTTICLHMRGCINLLGDFLIAPQKFGLLRSIISVGQVCDRGSITRNTRGTILNEFSGNRVEFERVNGVYRWRKRRRT